ncbi:SE1561 family protein [Alkalicoccus chagannorensis]|uniref:SE1561 family protein n=1 Tax=Alkalicoccus chagannorensis TaxID=427072 RepID=UPI00042315E4|nr:SE1561 family protein [Alkalicoccus chagannorensis]
MADEKQRKLHQLQDRMDMLMEMLDNLDPEETSIEDIDQLISRLDELETQCRQYRSHYE